MANSISLTTKRSNAFYRNSIEVEGYKHSGAASGGGSNWLESTALAGLVEENIVSSGTGYRTTYYDGAGNRTVLYSAGKNWLTGEPVILSMVLTREDTGAVTDTELGGLYEADRVSITSTFPTSATAYAIHGFAHKTPADYTKCFQWRMIYIDSGTGAGQVRRIKAVTDDGTTVKIFVSEAWTITPDNTSTFKICWHPLDIYYADLASVANAAIGAISNAPTAGGTGYAVGNTLTITTGGGNATVMVEAVSGGIVTAVRLVSCGTGYSTGAGQATSGGSGTGCTINITQIGWQVAYAAWDQQTGRIPLNMELVGDLKIGQFVDTYWGFTDFELIGGGLVGEYSWGGDQGWYQDQYAKCFYGSASWGASVNDSPIGYQDRPVITKIWRRRQAADCGGFGVSNLAEVWAVGNVIKLAGAFGSRTRSMFSDVVGKGLSWYNHKLVNVPRTTRSVGDIGEYIGGDWWGYRSPFQTSSLSANAIYAAFKSRNSTSVTLAGTFGLGWVYADNMGLSKPYWFNGLNTNGGILGQILNADGSQCDWWSLSYVNSGLWDRWIERKGIDIAVVDARSGNPIEGVSIEIKNVRGEVVSFEETGASITADMTDSQTTMDVDLRENLVTGEELFFGGIDSWESITLGTVAGSGAGTLSGITRESDLPLHFPKTAHKFNTAGFDKKLYRRTRITTDSNGQVPTQAFPAYTHSILDASGTANASQVTNGGVNYKCILNHQSSAATEPGVGAGWATYWTVSGTEGFPWRVDAQYHQGGVNGKISWTYHGPFSVVVKKAGYVGFTDTFDPTVDYEATNKVIKLKRPNLSMADSMKFDN